MHLPRRNLATTLALTVLLTSSNFVASAAPKYNVNVFAASSLQSQYSALAQKFMAAHPQIKINIAFGSSSTLANQIASGAQVDIFVSADRASMATVSKEFPNPSNYLVNQVVLAAPVNSPIEKISDLNKGIKWIQCAHTVPCGIAADSALTSESTVTTSPVSLELSASSTLAKLLAGAVDAAIVYQTDVKANQSKLKAIYFRDLSAASTTYQIGISKSAVSKKNLAASIFLSNLKSKFVLNSLTRAGFQIAER